MIQKFREDERESIYQEYIDRIGEITTGTAQRYEGGSLVIQIGRAEGFMPRSEQIPGEQHTPGERVRCLILDVRDTGSQVKIVLSRGNPEFIRRLFEVEVPEVAERIIEIKALAREPGHRTKVAVSSIDSKVDAVGACVGVRGSRIKNIVDELAGEKIDIVRWNESSQVLIANALRPAEVVETSLCFELSRATVVVNEDQLSLAIGKRGQNVRLAARLTGWDVDILTPPEFSKGLDILEQVLLAIDGVTEEMVDRLAALGFISVFDIEEVGPDVLQGHLADFELSLEKAEEAVDRCSEKAKEVAEEMERQKQEDERRKAEEAAGIVSSDSADAQAAAILGATGSAASEPESAPIDEDMEGDIVDVLKARKPEAAAEASASPPSETETPEAETPEAETTAAETGESESAPTAETEQPAEQGDNETATEPQETAADQPIEQAVEATEAAEGDAAESQAEKP
jgi:N utilization substance protein A